MEGEIVFNLFFGSLFMAPSTVLAWQRYPLRLLRHPPYLLMSYTPVPAPTDVRT